MPLVAQMEATVTNYLIMKQQTSFTNPDNTWWTSILGLVVLTCLSGYTIGLMDVDAAQYASMSREMAESGSWLQLTNRHEPYLDKPPLLFWLGAAFISIFGAFDWAYRLPTLFMALLGARASYGIASLYYSKNTAWLSALMFMSSQAILLTTHDSRTDTVLASSVALCIWQLLRFLQTNHWSNLYLGALGMGMALLAKGPIGAVVPIIAIGTDILLKRNWKAILKLEWFTLLAIVALVLAPMCYGLYQQWGTHGLRFYFWIQSFGRITGENEWDNNVDPTFLFTNFLWSWLPWTPWLLYGLYTKTSQLIKSKFKLQAGDDAVSLIAFIVPIVLLSTSHYQLPHYSYVILSMAAVLSAQAFEHSIRYALGLKLGWGFVGLLAFTAALLLYLSTFVSDVNPLEAWPMWVGFVVLALVYRLYLTKEADAPTKLIAAVVCVYMGANLVLNFRIYPAVLPYQAPTTVVKYLKEQNISLNEYVTYNLESQSADFYAARAIPNFLSAKDMKAKLVPDQRYWMLIREKDLVQLDSIGLHYERIRQFDDFHVSMLTVPFLNKATRKEATTPCWLVRTTRMGLAYNQRVGYGFLTTGPR